MSPSRATRLLQRLVGRGELVLAGERRSAHDERQYDEQQRVGEAWADERLVFTTTIGTPISPSSDTREFKAILKAAGLRDARLQDLRHIAAALLLAQGVAMRVVMEVLGHSQISLTMNTYSHITLAVLRAAADAVEDALWDSEDDG